MTFSFTKSLNDFLFSLILLDVFSSTFTNFYLYSIRKSTSTLTSHPQPAKMSEYSSMTVVQLKEALKAKNLATDGKKAELVARLEAAATSGESNNTGEPETAAPAPAEENSETKEFGEVKEPVAEVSDAQKVAESSAENVFEKKPERKVLTPEERKALAVDLLTKKIKRAEKFGDEAAATAAKKDLARVEKFGVDPSTALAKEIGALDRDVNTELSERKHRRSSGKSRRRGKGNKNNGNVSK